MRSPAREKVPWAIPLARLLTAGLAGLAGRVDEAVAALAAAEPELEAAGMELHLAVARRRRGELLGDAGAELVAQADAWLTAQGVANPARLAALFVPGRQPDLPTPERSP